MIIRNEDIFITQEEEDDLDYADVGYDEELANEFYEDILSFLTELIRKEEVVTEMFISNKCLIDHFNKHCIGNRTGRKSTRTNVLYDFKDKSQYKEYEKALGDKIDKTIYTVGSLYDYERILYLLRKLFEGDIVIQFCNACGLRNNNGVINLSIYAFSSSVTQNYNDGNTVDICVRSGRGRTITLYPLDSHYLQTKINKLIKKYSGRFDIDSYKFNND